ncbi:MAG: 23S rRNA (adenine(1618)-N(6))-methyltransferase RlmF [Flavobacteriaceae bacterium]
MHPKNLHNNTYQFNDLIKSHNELSKHVFVNSYNTQTIDFSDQKAVLELNKALLKHHYNLTNWSIPNGYLCPPIPGRADYIHYIADLLTENNISTQIKGLDIGVGANCIYPILANRIYNWSMVGADIDEAAVASAHQNIKGTPDLENYIKIRHQKDNANIFKGIINKGEYYHFTMCNPPFHSSEKDAKKGTLKKLKNLGQDTTFSLNFGGQSNELWCNGGEALFIKRMIKQSVDFKNQVTWFTCLVSKKDNLPKLYKQLNKLKASYKTIDMTQGQKHSRFIAWTF